VAGDAVWPPLDARHWARVSAETHPADERHAYPMTFEVWEKR
jgi:dihydrofolate reductase